MKLNKKNGLLKFCRKTLNGFKKFFVGLLEKFMKLDIIVRRIVELWVIIGIIFVIFVVANNINNKFIAKNEDYEVELKNAAVYYMEENQLYYTSSSKVKIDLDMLIENGYLYKGAIDHSCKGYALGYYNESEGKYKANAYISCKHYTTKNYGK